MKRDYHAALEELCTERYMQADFKKPSLEAIDKAALLQVVNLIPMDPSIPPLKYPSITPLLCPCSAFLLPLDQQDLLKKLDEIMALAGSQKLL